MRPGLYLISLLFLAGDANAFGNVLMMKKRASGGGGGGVTVVNSIARVTGTPGNNVDITTVSFTPPNTSLVLAMVNADTDSSNGVTMSVSDSLGGSWTKAAEFDWSDGGAPGHVSAWYRRVTTGAAMTVRARRIDNSLASNAVSLKVYVVTGHSTSAPIGAVSSGEVGTNTLVGSYVSTKANSLAFAVASDWFENGNPTSAGNVVDAAGITNNSVIALYAGSNTPAAGTTVNISIDAPGTGLAAWNYAVFEVVPP